jgi:hypothetical protein
LASTNGSLQERDINGQAFTTGDYVLVRCIVSSITPAATGGLGGAGDSINLTVETPGNPGEKQNVTLTVSPIQCRKAGNPQQA